MLCETALLMASYETEWGKTPAILGLVLETPSFRDCIKSVSKGQKSLQDIILLLNVILCLALKLFYVSKGYYRKIY